MYGACFAYSSTSSRFQRRGCTDNKQTNKQKNVHAPKPRQRVMIVFTGVLHSRGCSVALVGVLRDGFCTTVTVRKNQRHAFMKREGQKFGFCVTASRGCESTRSESSTQLTVGVSSHPQFHGADSRYIMWMTHFRCHERLWICWCRQHALMSLHLSRRVAKGETKMSSVMCTRGYTVHAAFSALPGSLFARSSRESELFISLWGSQQWRGVGSHRPPIDSSGLRGETWSDRQAKAKGQRGHVEEIERN